MKTVTRLSRLLEREERSCRYCFSSLRARGIVHLLSLGLFQKSMPLVDFPLSKELKGIGMSDTGEYPNYLEKKFSYQNTFYHKEPRLDITDISDREEEKYNFIISADVFEHLNPPVSKAFVNTKKLLKKDGVLILTVPFLPYGEETIEHFPDLYDYKILQNKNGKYYLENITRNNERQIFNDLVFHGGPGSTLEMRLFTKSSLLKELLNAGFREIQVLEKPIWRFGIYHREKWSLPILAR